MDTVNTKGDERTHNSTIQGTAVALYEIGGAIGGIISLYIGNRLGRLKMIWMGHFIVIIGAILQCSSYSLAQFIVARILTGVGTGINTVMIPVWTSESSRSHKRGTYVTVEAAMITGGICLSYWLDFAFHYIQGSSIAWRFPIAFQTLFGIVVCLIILDLPESPRWLMQKNRYDEARYNLQCLYGDVDPQIIEADMLEIQAALAVSSEYSWKSLFDNKGPTKNFHRFSLGLAHAVFHQMSGINLIVYYASTLYQQYLGLSADDSRIVTATVNGTAYFFCSFISIALIERVGRRKMMLTGSAGMALGMAALAATSAFPGQKGPSSAGAFFLFFVQFFWAIGWLVPVYLYPVELVPLHIRVETVGIMNATTWIFNFLIVEITPISLSTIQWRTYLIFVSMNVAIGICIYFFYPETAYRSLEEIDEIFATSKNVFDVVRTARMLPHRHDRHGRIDTEAAKASEFYQHELEIVQQEVLQHENIVSVPGPKAGG